MIMSEPSPKAITANRETSQLTIEWNDGHTSLYPLGCSALPVLARAAGVDTNICARNQTLKRSQKP